VQKRYFLLALICLPVLLYLNALPNAFQYDDLHTLVNNPHIRSETFGDALAKLPDFFVSSQYYSGETHHVSHFRPVLYATYIMNYAVTGLSPVGFRGVNLGLHIGCVVLVYFLARRLLGDSVMAFLSALILAIHPFFSEAVNYISARSSLLATLFYLMSFYNFIRYRDCWGTVRPAVIHYSLFLLFLILAFLSKEIALTLPLILVIYDLQFTQFKGPRKSFKMFLPYLPVAAASLFLLHEIDFLQYLNNTYLNNHFSTDNFKVILAQIKGLALMFWLFVLPLGLSIDHGSLRVDSLLDPVLAGAILVLMGILVCAFLLRRSQPALAFSLHWFMVTAIPTTLVPLNVPFLEHRGYLPGIGLTIILGYILTRVGRGEWLTVREGRPKPFPFPWAMVLIVLVLVFYGGITVHQNKVWKDQITLWRKAVEKVPGSERAWTNLGLAYLSSQDQAHALEAFNEALLIRPENPIALVGKGSLYHAQGKIDEAIEAYQKALKVQSSYFLSHFNLGVAYQQKGDLEKALQAYQEALKLNAHHPQTHLNLGSIYLALGKYELAIEEYRESLRLDPESTDAHYNLGVTYETLGRTDLANDHYRKSRHLR